MSDMVRGSWHAVEGMAVQYIKMCKNECCAIVKVGEDILYVHPDALESILTCELSLCYKPTREELSVAIENIHRKHGYQPAMKALADALLRSWHMNKETVKFILHDLWRDKLPGNPEDVWDQSATLDGEMLANHVEIPQEIR